MNVSMQKLMRMSRLLRVLILLAATTVIFYLAYGYFIDDKIYFNSSALFFALWDNPSASQPFLLASKLPLLLSFLLGVYWLQKLLSHYQQGQFFGPDSMHCYLWLVWLKLASFILDIIDTLLIGNYARHFQDTVSIELTVDFNEITTILLMLVIVYLLKAAKEIEAENKEFI
ncbi:DUF2975 domain-containing protein [Pseudoalteromonas sp. MMG012]|uniref:DUF2975 domain-containing protein n=1 Tax=Pseudoalteromonas sp. MMG012 TaxID=2822686 RepID=UPI001B3A36D6|nr:DUF2975 domain-containing protein [Pseudoalteromonas sp. MMG012]MBQ4852743.1 DUF2975 domain-containing protein [Pseudoalteromonas sp. MMG012]